MTFISLNKVLRKFVEVALVIAKTTTTKIAFLKSFYIFKILKNLNLK